MHFLIPVLALVLIALVHVPAAEAQGCSGGIGVMAGGCSGSQGSGPVRRLFSGGLLHRGTSGGLFARRSSRTAPVAQATVIQVGPETPPAAPPAPKAMP